MVYVDRLSEMNMLQWIILPFTEVIGATLFYTILFALTMSLMYLKNQSYFIPYMMIFWTLAMVVNVTDVRNVFSAGIMGWIVALFLIGLLSLMLLAIKEFKRMAN